MTLGESNLSDGNLANTIQLDVVATTYYKDK